MQMKAILISFVSMFLPISLLAGDISITPMVGFPSSERGYEQGVSACYAGCIGDMLIMAGGANFAEKPVAEGGKKCFYKGIYAAKITSADTLLWEKVGELPLAMAYGTTVAVGDRLILIGGSSAEGSLNSVFSLTMVQGKAEINELPSLPVALDNMSAAIYNNKVYVAGGSSNGKEQAEVYVLDMKKRSPRWQRQKKHTAVPQRQRIGMQTVAVVPKGKLMILGGYSSADGSHPAEVYDGPSGGALAQTSDGRIFVAGGVNHDIFLDAISGRYEFVAKDDYLKKPVEWYRFDGRLQQFDPTTCTYSTLVESPFLARAGAVLVAYKETIFSIGGETKPGIRSPLVVRVEL